MFIVGLTGGIGSGKTAASDHFKSLGITIVDADEASRAAVEPGSAALEKIRQHFGERVITGDGGLDRRRLRELIFDDDDKRLWLNRLLHPLIGLEMQRAMGASDSAYTVVVNPLMRTRLPYMNRVLVIDVPQAVQVRRVMSRDNCDAGQARAIIATQLDRVHRLEMADDVVVNNADLAALRRQLEPLHLRYLELGVAA